MNEKELQVAENLLNEMVNSPENRSLLINDYRNLISAASMRRDLDSPPSAKNLTAATETQTTDH